jgi:hypothetical protein
MQGSCDPDPTPSEQASLVGVHDVLQGARIWVVEHSCARLATVTPQLNHIDQCVASTLNPKKGGAAHLLDQGRHVQRVIGHAPGPPAEPRAVVPLRRPHLAHGTENSRLD